jgi:hypothetical protein
LSFFYFLKEFMQCPICSTEIGNEAVDCAKCGATRITRRSSVGVLVGWLGMLVAICWGMIWLFLLALLVFGHDLNGFPWSTLILGTVVAAGLLLYSKSTIKAHWVRRED